MLRNSNLRQASPAIGILSRSSTHNSHHLLNVAATRPIYAHSRTDDIPEVCRDTADPCSLPCARSRASRVPYGARDSRAYELSYTIDRRHGARADGFPSDCAGNCYQVATTYSHHNITRSRGQS